MAVYNVTSAQTSIGTLAEVRAAMEAIIDAVDTAKTIRHQQVLHVGNNPDPATDCWIGIVEYDA